MKKLFFEIRIWNFQKLLHKDTYQFDNTDQATFFAKGLETAYRNTKGATGCGMTEVGEFPPKLSAFVDSYLHTASWITCDSDENTDFTKTAIEQAETDCLIFIDKVRETFGIDKGNQLLTIEGNDLTYLAPHDLFLTRNGHGSGFWDKPEYYGKDEAAKLTEIAHSMGEADCYHVRGKKSKLTF